MYLKRLIATVLMLPALSSPVLALDGNLVGLDGMKIVVVWNDSDAQSEGFSLIQAGVLKSNPELLAPLISCIVPTGTKVVVTDAGFATHDVMVIDGEFSGCRGNIPTETLKLN